MYIIAIIIINIIIILLINILIIITIIIIYLIIIIYYSCPSLHPRMEPALGAREDIVTNISLLYYYYYYYHYYYCYNMLLFIFLVEIIIIYYSCPALGAPEKEGPRTQTLQTSKSHKAFGKAHETT